MKSTDHYSLAYDGALLLLIPLCISRAFLVVLLLEVNVLFFAHSVHVSHVMNIF